MAVDWFCDVVVESLLLRRPSLRSRVLEGLDLDCSRCYSGWLAILGSLSLVEEPQKQIKLKCKIHHMSWYCVPKYFYYRYPTSPIFLVDSLTSVRHLDMRTRGLALAKLDNPLVLRWQLLAVVDPAFPLSPFLDTDCRGLYSWYEPGQGTLLMEVRSDRGPRE